MILSNLILLILIILVLFVVVLGLISIMVHFIIIILIIWVIVIILLGFVASFDELIVLVNEIFRHIIIGNQSLPLNNFLLIIKVHIFGIFDLFLVLVVGVRLLLVNGLHEIFFALDEPFAVFRIGMGLILLQWCQVKLLKFVIVGVPTRMILNFRFYVHHDFFVRRHQHKRDRSFWHRFDLCAYSLVFEEKLNDVLDFEKLARKTRR